MIVLYYKVGIKSVLSSLADFNLLYLIPVILLFLIGLFLSMLNIKILLNGLKRKIGFYFLLKNFLFSWSVALVTPGRLGDFSLALMINKNKKYGDVIGVVLLDKLITIISYLAISLIGLFLIFNLASVGIKIVYIVIPVIIIFMFIILSESGRRLIINLMPKKFSIKFKGFNKSLKILLTKRFGFVALNLLVTILNLIVNTFVYFMIFKGFGYDVGLIYIFIINAMVKIISLIPITFSGIGIRESIGTYLYGSIGIPPHIAGGAYLINLIKIYTFGIIFLYLTKDNVFAQKSNRSLLS